MDPLASLQDPRITAELRTMLDVVPVLRDRQETVVRANSRASEVVAGAPVPPPLPRRHRSARLIPAVGGRHDHGIPVGEELEDDRPLPPRPPAAGREQEGTTFQGRVIPPRVH